MTKYSSIYQKLLDKSAALQIARKSSNEYYELHHIIPRALGGSNTAENLILLSAREHYVAHRLLYHIHSGIAKNKMAHAWFCMCRNSDGQARYINSYAYELARKAHAKAVSLQFKDKKYSAEMCEKRRGAGNPNAKSCTIAGKTFACAIEAAKFFNVGRRMIAKFKQGLVSEQYVTDPEYRRKIRADKLSKANMGNGKGISYEEKYGPVKALELKKLRYLAKMGSKLSNETKAKIAAKHIGVATRPKGFIMSDTQKENISKSKIGKSYSLKNYAITDPTGIEYIVVKTGIRAWWRNKFGAEIPNLLHSIKGDVLIAEGDWKGWKIKVINNEI